MPTPDLDLALAFPGLRQIVGELHPQPCFRGATKRLREPDRHLGADPRLAVDDVVERLPSDAESLRSLRDGQAQGLKTRGSDTASGVWRVFHRHGILLLVCWFPSDSQSVRRQTNPRLQSGR
jgi:hypothetical protein